ncbi:MAG: hypothetical protein KKA07_01390 [Bacteroidetes bacterium]|nr:hypothetical protein [Bacteroidota bacterium]MBU1717703.1 hypothetical protein [Bacteroidota bacterium]
MKKFKLAVAAIAVLFAGSMFAQPVHDNGVVPVAVTLNSVLRLNIVSGGNIEFVFNNVQEYKVGKANGGANDLYTTNVTVAASNDWNLRLMAEDATLIGTDDNGNTMALDNVGYAVSFNGIAAYAFAAKNACATAYVGTYANAAVLTNAYVDVITPNGASHNAGEVTDNDFIFYWAAGTGAGALTNTSFIEQNLTPDRYVTNVFLNLERL